MITRVSSTRPTYWTMKTNLLTPASIHLICDTCATIELSKKNAACAAWMHHQQKELVNRVWMANMRITPMRLLAMPFNSVELVAKMVAPPFLFPKIVPYFHICDPNRGCTGVDPHVNVFVFQCVRKGGWFRLASYYFLVTFLTWDMFSNVRHNGTPIPNLFALKLSTLSCSVHWIIWQTLKSKTALQVLYVHLQQVKFATLMGRLLHYRRLARRFLNDFCTIAAQCCIKLVCRNDGDNQTSLGAINANNCANPNKHLAKVSAKLMEHLLKRHTLICFEKKLVMPGTLHTRQHWQRDGGTNGCHARWCEGHICGRTCIARWIWVQCL